VFGSGMNEREYRSILEFISKASAYNEHVRESINYSTQDLSDYYTENRDLLDVFFYRQFLVSAVHPIAEDFDDEDDFDAAVLEAIAEAGIVAAEIAGEIVTEVDFIAAALEYNDWFYAEPDSTLRMAQGERLDSSVEEWLLDETRSAGDIDIIESEQGSTIVFFVNRDDNRYRTVGMRQILILREQINPEDFPGWEDDPDYIEALENAENEARERANLVNSLFIAAGQTEDALIDLMNEHSDDTMPGGLYEDITMFSYQTATLQTMKVVPEIEDWLFDPGRVQGDSELIYTSAFGYHLVYFTGFGDPFFELIADDRMRTRDHTEWLDDLTIGQPVRHFAFILVHV